MSIVVGCSFCTNRCKAVGDNNYGTVDFRHPDWEENIGKRYGQYIQRRSDGLFPYQTSASQRFFPAIGNHDVSRTNARDSFIGGVALGAAALVAVHFRRRNMFK